MADKITKKQRSYIMSQIRGKDTEPEILLRKALREKWLKWYRLHRKGLKRRPDVIFGKTKLLIFVDWCFRHGCPKCFKKPKSNLRYRNKKIKDNIERDKRTNRELRKDGRKVMRIWEHDVREEKSLKTFIKKLDMLII